MLKITKYSIPVVLAGLVIAGHTQESDSQRKQSSSSSGQQSLQAQQQQQRQQKLQEEQQQLQKDQQRNQQSLFQPGQITDSQLKKQVTEVNKASSFIGMAVKNTQNEDLGKINDLVFDPEKGKISYAVLSVGGVLGVGDKLVAVPVTSLKPQPGQKYLVLNMQKSQVQSAPGLAQNNWPDLDAPGLGGAAGSESGSAGASQSDSSSGISPSSSSPSSSSPSGSSDRSSSSTSQGSPSSTSSGSSATGTSGTSSSGSNSDASASKSSETDDSTASDIKPDQGESKKTDDQ
ncbi:MAG TPA: PRC-barrel domain-containing protein [Candidatus Kapabacteria bacterium]|nr:PRC-barrel domain-containing protein [Candidatus Kapabacteria bacterium]